jgi:hypothetical protein
VLWAVVHSGNAPQNSRHSFDALSKYGKVTQNHVGTRERHTEICYIKVILY